MDKETAVSKDTAVFYIRNCEVQEVLFMILLVRKNMY
jgi:hypothetical protein